MTPVVIGLTQRLVALLDHLDLERIFIATQMPGDIAGLCRQHQDRIAALALVIPSRIEPGVLQGMDHRLMILAGDSGIPTEAADRTVSILPAARQTRLPGYAATAWSDIAAELPEQLCTELTRFFDAFTLEPAGRLPRSGTVEGLNWRATGQGPPLLLPPFFLAASQWGPVVDRLSRTFTVITLGGPHIGGAAMLEDRASLPGYRDMFETLLRRMAVPEGARVLEVGCGTAALCRHLVHARQDVHVTGVDINGYLLREGRALARSEGLSAQGTEPGALRLEIGNAVDLPLPDCAFDAVYSVTVLEECDGDAALREMVRVARPGAPIGVAVRALDLPQWWNLDLPAPMAELASRQPQSSSPGSVADRSLYRRMIAAGLEQVRGFPYLLTFDRPEGPMWTYRAAHVRAALGPADQALWDDACERAAAAGLLFQANPLHCAVGRRARSTANAC